MMEEKKCFKISLTTTILLFLLLVILVAGAFFYFVLEKRHEEEKLFLQQQINQLQKDENNIAKEEIVDVSKYEGVWYQNADTFGMEKLEIKDVKKNKASINIFFYRIATMEDTTVTFIGNKAVFEEENEEHSGKVSGEIVLEKDNIVVLIKESSVYGVSANKKYTFSCKEQTLDNTDKIKINKNLKTYLTLPLREMTEIEQGHVLELGVNLLNKEKNRFYIVINAMQYNIGDEFGNTDINGNEVTGVANISINKVNEYYMDIFGKEMNEQELLDSTIFAYEVKIKDGTLYCVYPSGWGGNPFELKASALGKDNKTEEYVLVADVLMKINNNTNTEHTQFDEDVTLEYGDPSILEYPTEFCNSKLKLKYKIDSEGNNIITSIVFDH